MGESPGQEKNFGTSGSKKSCFVSEIWPFGICVRADSYLIFVIFFTQARFLENKIYTEERVNYDKWILRQNSVNRDLLGQANYKDQDYTKFVTHCV